MFEFDSPKLKLDHHHLYYFSGMAISNHKTSDTQPMATCKYISTVETVVHHHLHKYFESVANLLVNGFQHPVETSLLTLLRSWELKLTADPPEAAAIADCRRAN
ncbi:hypothetical protein Nepgr_009131 [Nepenthes gracilis]|uniref:Uncharacterized protein n=1 Tax=Nepenthes gracilis TaxID=150966 RepID=A0AAD3XK45_NEPGR|nr:hypothetical protein Nepgr_009131 [Nepenthes gracilis]